MNAAGAAVDTTLGEILDTLGRERHQLLQVLIRLQERFSYIPATAINQLALMLGISQTEISGIIDFYSFLHCEPRGHYDIYFSDNIIDQMSGGRDRAAMLGRLIDCPVGGSNGRASISFTSCTGLCDQAPGMLVNGQAISATEERRVEQMARYINGGTPVETWPEHWFRIEDNIRRRDQILDEHLAQGEAISEVLETMSGGGFLERLDAAGLRGRGGAGFSTALKWQLCRASSGPRVVVCNADEGEPGTFKDRVLLQSAAHAVIEGMTICAATVGANTGFIYLRGEYRFLLPHLERVLEARRSNGLLGSRILGRKDFHFDIRIHLGAGSYVCGEESALIESLEGKRGIPRIRPPFPSEVGYCGRPTVVNNVETFLKTAYIAAFSDSWFRARGTGQSGGTKLLSVSGDCAYPGIYEFPFGTPVSEVLRESGAGQPTFLQVGGPAGLTLTPREFERSIAFEDVPTGGSFMIFDVSRPILDVVTNFMDFFVHESCGFCTPCRVGGQLLRNRLRKLAEGRGSAEDLDRIREIGAVMRNSSQCGLGHSAPNSVLDTMERFPKVYHDRLARQDFTPAFNLDDALSEARRISGRDDPGSHIKSKAGSGARTRSKS